MCKICNVRNLPPQSSLLWYLLVFLLLVVLTRFGLVVLCNFASVNAHAAYDTDSLKAPALDQGSILFRCLADYGDFDCVFCAVFFADIDDLLRDLYVFESDLPYHLIILPICLWCYTHVNFLSVGPFGGVFIALLVHAQVFLPGKADLHQVGYLLVDIEVEVMVVDVVDADVYLVPIRRDMFCHCPAIQVSRLVELEDLLLQASVMPSPNFPECLLVLHLIVDSIREYFTLSSLALLDFLVVCVIEHLI